MLFLAGIDRAIGNDLFRLFGKRDTTFRSLEARFHEGSPDRIGANAEDSWLIIRRLAEAFSNEVFA